MKKIWDSIARDLWIVLLDIIAVNAAYFLALLVRFYVNFEFRPTVQYLIGDWAKFIPFYTVLCILIFALFRLYGGMWRFAGINDMNRIIGANLCSVVVMVVGTALFIRRMPITYYVIGAILQFLFISLIRFGYRILLVEKKKVAGRNTPSVPAMVIGAGETARKAIAHLEDTPFRAVVAADEKSAGKILNGVPVVADYSESLSSVRAVFIADGTLSAEKRKEIFEKCAELDIEVQDYTGYQNNMAGRIPLATLLSVSSGAVTVVNGNERRVYTSPDAALNEIPDRMDIERIMNPEIVLKKPEESNWNAWAEAYSSTTGQDVGIV